VALTAKSLGSCSYLLGIDAKSVEVKKVEMKKIVKLIRVKSDILSLLKYNIIL
jgi:hypothetical protein